MGLFDKFKRETGNFWLDDYNFDDFKDIYDKRSDESFLKQTIKYDRDIHRKTLACNFLFMLGKKEDIIENRSIEDYEFPVFLTNLVFDDHALTQMECEEVMDDTMALAAALSKKNIFEGL